MKNTIFVFLIITLSFCLSKISNAQETQISIDEEGKIEYINSELEQELGLFKEYHNFKEARLFQISDTSYVLEISYRPEDKLLRARLPLSASEVQEFKQKVMNRIEKKAPTTVLDQEGRTKLIVGSTTLSFGYYGWVIPVYFEADD